MSPAIAKCAPGGEHPQPPAPLRTPKLSRVGFQSHLAHGSDLLSANRIIHRSDVKVHVLLEDQLECGANPTEICTVMVYELCCAGNAVLASSRPLQAPYVPGGRDGQQAARTPLVMFTRGVSSSVSQNLIGGAADSSKQP